MLPIRFSVFRICLGIYIAVHFLQLLPFSSDLFSNEGMLPQANQNPTYGLFPINLLNWFDDPMLVNIFLSLLVVASLSLAVGFKRRWMAAILLYGWIALFNRNNLILVPGMAFIGWFLLNMIFIEEGEPYSLRSKKKSDWEMPKIVFAGTWLLMALGYTLSGIDKWHSVSWEDGSAIHKLLENPLMNDNAAVHLFQNASGGTHTAVTYFILFLEISFLPLALLKFARPIIWTSMVFVHISILVLMNMADLSISMLLLHLFTFDSEWLYFGKKKLDPIPD